MPTIHWYCLVPQQEEFCRNALEELAAKLPKLDDRLPVLTIERISDADAAFVPDFISLDTSTHPYLFLCPRNIDLIVNIN